MSDKHLLRVCWGMCIFCVLVLLSCLVALVANEHTPRDAGDIALCGVMALIVFWPFFSIAHDEQSQ
jgi:hypothetical protein